jgi:tryptophan synthase alpha chain
VSRITECFATARQGGRKVLIPYITAGDPRPAATVPLMHALVGAGADVLEIGVPFSDPMADGPVIQAACERALAHNTGLRDILRMIAEFRTRDARTPVVLMGYLNPVEAMGYEVFADAAAAAGIDGVLLVDLTAEEAGEVVPLMRARGLDTIFLIAPTSTDARIKAIAGQASGYLYYVSFKGVTGADRLDTDDVAANLARVRKHSVLPVAVGFGIRDPQSAAAVGGIADAVVVGSALVSRIAEFGSDEAKLPGEVSKVLGGMRAALDAADRSEHLKQA